MATPDIQQLEATLPGMHYLDAAHFDREVESIAAGHIAEDESVTSVVLVLYSTSRLSRLTHATRLAWALACTVDEKRCRCTRVFEHGRTGRQI